MNSIESHLEEINWNNHDEVISFYESNRLYFDNAGLVADDEKLNDLIGVSLRYADALYNRSQFDKSTKVIERANELLKKFDQTNPNYARFERNARFLKGMILGQQNNYQESYPIFKQLIREDPDHHYYQVWYIYTRLGLYNWIFNGLLIFGTIIIFSDLLLSLDKYWPFDPGLYGLIIVAGTFIAQKVVHYYFKKGAKR